MTFAIGEGQISRLALPSLEAAEDYDIRYPSDAAYSPDGKWLALGGWSGGRLVSIT